MKEKELRDEFAMAAMNAVIVSRGTAVFPEDSITHQRVAEIAYRIADACMKEREKKP